jgi:hypothetical protein
MAPLFLSDSGAICILAMAAYVAATVSHFVATEIFNMAIPSISRALATGWNWAVISMLGMKVIIHVTIEVIRAMKPGTCSNKDTATKPFGTVVSIRSAVVRRHLVVPIGAYWSGADIDADLSLCFMAG